MHYDPPNCASYQQNFIHPVTSKLTVHLAYEKTVSHILHPLLVLVIVTILSHPINNRIYMLGITSHVICIHCMIYALLFLVEIKQEQTILNDLWQCNEVINT